MITRALFFFVLAIEIYFSSTHQTLGMLLTKPLLMPILMLLAFQLKIKDKALYFELFFSLLGDVFLMFSGEKFFMMGLGSFLLAHVFYILLFKTEFKFQPLKTLPFVIITSAYFLIIKPGIDQNLILPVLAYCVVITLMGIFASNRITNRTSYITILIGSILFVISDSLIAFNKFYAPLPMSTLWIMSTYGIAQYLIVTGWAAKRY